MSQTQQPAADRAEQSRFAVWGKLSGAFLTPLKSSREECERFFQPGIDRDLYEVRELRTRWDAPQADGPQWWGLKHKRTGKWLSRADAVKGVTDACESAEAADNQRCRLFDADEFEVRPLCPRVESAPGQKWSLWHREQKRWLGCSYEGQLPSLPSSISSTPHDAETWRLEGSFGDSWEVRPIPQATESAPAPDNDGYDKLCKSDLWMIDEAIKRAGAKYPKATPAEIQVEICAGYCDERPAKPAPLPVSWWLELSAVCFLAGVFAVLVARAAGWIR